MSEPSFDILQELAKLIEGLNEKRIEYAIIGGWAVAIYGYPRFTTDIDFMVRKEELEETKKVLKENGFFIDNGLIPLPSAGVEFYRMTKIVEGDFLVVDIQFLEEHDAVWRNRRWVDWSGGKVCVIDIRDLIEMKSKSERAKDKQDIEELKKIYEID